MVTGEVLGREMPHAPSLVFLYLWANKILADSLRTLKAMMLFMFSQRQ